MTQPFDEHDLFDDIEDEDEDFVFDRSPIVEPNVVEPIVENEAPIEEPPRIVVQCRACKLDMMLPIGATRPPSVCPSCRVVNMFVALPLGTMTIENVNPSRKRPPRTGSMPFTLRPHMAPRPVREKPQAIRMSDVDTGGSEVRHCTGIALFDRAVGLCDAPGHVVGDCSAWSGPPGTGKSTLLLEALQGYARAGLTCLYSAGEEALRRVALRAKRIGLTTEEMDRIHIIRNNDVDDACAEALRLDVDVLLVDSAQTHTSRQCDGGPASLLQIAHSAQLLAELAHGDEDKKPNARFKGHRPRIVLVINHADKNGDMAGPNAARHHVDALYLFEHFDPITLDTLEPKKRKGFVRALCEKNRSGDAQGRTVTDEDGEETDLEFQWVKPGKVVSFDRAAWMASKSNKRDEDSDTNKEESHA